MRQVRGTYEVLLISSVSRPGRWTLPKGTLEHGEHPESTASREVAEEAGVRGRLLRSLGIVVRERDAIAFYLFRYRHEVEWVEGAVRERRWVRLERAERHLRQADLHDVIEAARRVLRGR